MMTYRKNWTSGPWRLEEDDIIVAANGEPIADARYFHHQDGDTLEHAPGWQANLQLAINAERLFEALEQIVSAWESPEMRNLWNECVDRLGGYDGPFADMKEARAALLAADGQEEG